MITGTIMGWVVYRNIKVNGLPNKVIVIRSNDGGFTVSMDNYVAEGDTIKEGVNNLKKMYALVSLKY